MMKTSIKSMAAMAMAAFVWAGCVDTSVSPEVKAIRAAQASYLQASADLRAAEAAIKAVQLDEEKAVLDLKLSEVARDKKVAEAALKVAEATLETAVQNLAKIVAESGSAAAATYLTNYQTQLTTLNGLYAARIAKQSELSTAQLLLDATEDVPFDLIKDKFKEVWILKKQILLHNRQNLQRSWQLKMLLELKLS